MLVFYIEHQHLQVRVNAYTKLISKQQQINFFIMAEPTLQQVFGTGATQTATELIIAKSDLAALGLTASATNTAESLTVAVLLKAKEYLNDTNQATNGDIQITIEQSAFPQIVSRNSQNYRQITFNVDLQTIDTSFSIDPDNY